MNLDQLLASIAALAKLTPLTIPTLPLLLAKRNLRRFNRNRRLFTRNLGLFNRWVGLRVKRGSDIEAVRLSLSAFFFLPLGDAGVLHGRPLDWVFFRTGFTGKGLLRRGGGKAIAGTGRERGC